MKYIRRSIEEYVRKSEETFKCILVTGARQTGKSTMLKTITVAAIMAQSVNTVNATSYRAPAYKIYTSLSLKDDIISGDS